MSDDVFDLDALDREANKQPFKFRFDGVEYTCPDDISIEIIEAFEGKADGRFTGGDVVNMMEMILGPDQWASIKASPKVFGAARMAQVMDAYQDHLGIAVPNS